MIERGANVPTRAEIEALSDAAALALLYRDMVGTIEEIKAQIYGFRAAGIAEAGWLQRAGKKVGVMRMASRWAELRLIALDLPVPYLPSDPRREELRRSAEVIRRLLKALDEAGVARPLLPGRGRRGLVDG